MEKMGVDSVCEGRALAGHMVVPPPPHLREAGEPLNSLILPVEPHSQKPLIPTTNSSRFSQLRASSNKSL